MLLENNFAPIKPAITEWISKLSFVSKKCLLFYMSKWHFKQSVVSVHNFPIFYTSSSITNHSIEYLSTFSMEYMRFMRSATQETIYCSLWILLSAFLFCSNAFECNDECFCLQSAQVFYVRIFGCIFSVLIFCVLNKRKKSKSCLLCSSAI